MKVCIIGAPGKLGRYMVRHGLDRGNEIVEQVDDRDPWADDLGAA
jgi:putative NADH-flavin reductase